MSRRLLWVLLVAAVAPYVLNLGATSIIDANEAFYTETPREMLEAGDYLNSTFNYEPRFNKPPLSYWVVLASYLAFDVSLWAARIPIAIGAIVMIGTAYVLGRAVSSPLAGWLAAITLAATPRFLLFARRIIIDVYSAMFLCLALVCFVLAETDPTRRRRWLVLMYVATGLGVLTKGPVALVVPALVFPVYLWATGRLSTIRQLMLPTGVLIVSAIVTPYYMALYFEYGWDYIATFLLRENLARYAEGVGAPSRGPLFYLPVVFADFYFPWSLVLPVALGLVPWRRLAAWRPAAERPVTPAAGVAASDVRLLLGLWIVLIVAFFSFSRGQQDLYVFPFVPAAAALVGATLAQWIDGAASASLARWTRRAWLVMVGVLVLVGGVVAVFFLWGGSPIRLAGAALGGGVLVLAAGMSAALVGRQMPGRGVAAAVSGFVLLSWLVVYVSLPDFERYKPVPKLAAVIEAQTRRADAVGTYRVAAPSLVFYLRRHVDQMFDPAQLEAFFSEGGSAVRSDAPVRGLRYCVIRDTDYRAVRDVLSVGTRIVASTPRLDIRFEDLLEGIRELPQLHVITTVDGRW